MTALFDFDDIQLAPAAVSKINSRSEIDCTTFDDYLPLITAPMDTVVSNDNYYIFHENTIYTTTVREQNFELKKDYDHFQSMSLKQFKKFFVDNVEKIALKQPIKILIDIANGHMESLFRSIEKAKKRYGDMLIIMAGNVANPKTYFLLSQAGASYVRLGIGTGNGCLTTVHSGVGWPLASLVHNCRGIKVKEECTAAIVADGGMKNYDDIIKALALGADYVIVGSIFNKALESAGRTYTKEKTINQYSIRAKEMYEEGVEMFKEYRGMSTKAVQRKWANAIIKTSEGIEAVRPVEYTLSGWTENFEHYLRTAMSYCNARNLDEFIGNVDFNLITNNALARIKK